jgi:hypothetical protein
MVSRRSLAAKPPLIVNDGTTVRCHCRRRTGSGCLGRCCWSDPGPNWIRFGCPSWNRRGCWSCCVRCPMTSYGCCRQMIRDSDSSHHLGFRHDCSRSRRDCWNRSRTVRDYHLNRGFPPNDFRCSNVKTRSGHRRCRSGSGCRGRPRCTIPGLGYNHRRILAHDSTGCRRLRPRGFRRVDRRDFRCPGRTSHPRIAGCRCDPNRSPILNHVHWTIRRGRRDSGWSASRPDRNHN